MNIQKAGMAWVGKIISVSPIENADKIQRAEVVAGAGGKWAGVVSKDTRVDDLVVVFLPDAVVPQNEALSFMEKYGWRVRPMKLRGCPSEVLIVKTSDLGVTTDFTIGRDLTEVLGVLKYEKEMPAGIGGLVKGSFPSFIPKTDEPNFQRVPEMVEALRGKKFYSSVKYDGTSQTCFLKDGVFGVCSRNLELKESESSAGWVLARRYHIEEQLRYRCLNNLAFQWECVGPGIQGNPLGLNVVDLRVFNVYNIEAQTYYSVTDAFNLADSLGLPFVKIDKVGIFDFTDDELRKMAEGTYMESGRQREGIVVRPFEEMTIETEDGWQRVSFKVINLLYKEKE